MFVELAQWRPGPSAGRAPVGSPASYRVYYGYLIILCVVFVAISAVSAADIDAVLATVEEPRIFRTADY
jgi:hypothetical protein